MAKKSNADKGLEIKKDEVKDAIKARIVCKNCGKDFEYTKSVELHQQCPRCNAPLGRDLNKEEKDVKRTARRVIVYDFLRRNKKYLLFVGVLMTVAAITWNILGFFLQLFSQHGWWISLMSLPFIIISFICSSTISLRSTSTKIRVFSWLAVILNIIAIAAVIVTAIPQLNENLLTAYRL
jgi:DNA-directed RNA polymerase subunit RPC12/RpoP